MLTKEQKSKIINQFKQSKNDVGSCEIQIALLSEKIQHVSEHLKTFPKDRHSQRGLLKMVGQRKAFFNYLKKSNPKSYENLSQLLAK